MTNSKRMLLGFGALALGLAGVATYTLASRGPDLGAVLAGPGDEPLDPAEEAARERRERLASARNLDGMRRRDADIANAGEGDPGAAVDVTAAKDGFEVVMKKVERTADRGRRLDRDEWEDLYRSANDAFSALSMHLDATDPGDRDELERAHARLVEGLDRVRVRGNKKFID